MLGRAPCAGREGAAGQLVGAVTCLCVTHTPEIHLQECFMHQQLLFFTALYAVQVLLKCQAGRRDFINMPYNVSIKESL